MRLKELDADQRLAVEMMESTADPIFLTGRAGTGKTYVVKYFQENTRKRFAVCAPTGIAALNASGSTIHNLIGLGTTMPPDAHVDRVRLRSQHFNLTELDVLVVDEISMVSSDLLDAMDRNLQLIRRNNEPFGGLQLIMAGDLYQLPPVVTKEARAYYTDSGYRSEWFFDAHVWDRMGFETIALEKVHRQADQTFIRLLNGVRDGTIADADLNLLNALGRRPGKTKKATLLSAHRAAAESFNNENLSRIKGRRSTYTARVNAGFGYQAPADRELHLKSGARIMMLSNDREDRWVNGSQGVIETCGSEFISVILDDDTSHVVDRHSWVKADASMTPDELAKAPRFHQFPIKLSWAMTIHKSQGLSLNEVDIDLGQGAFSNGQTYVGLSRVTRPEGLFISTPIQRSDIRIDPNVQEFFATRT